MFYRPKGHILQAKKAYISKPLTVNGLQSYKVMRHTITFTKQSKTVFCNEKRHDSY